MAYPGYPAGAGYPNPYGGTGYPLGTAPVPPTAVPGYPGPSGQGTGYPGVSGAPQTGSPYGYMTVQYGAAPPVPSPEQRFIQYAGATGSINAEQLSQLLSESGYSGAFKTQFSLETCRIMVAMLDRNYDGTMNLQEFRDLLNALWHWRQTFDMHDKDRSGTIEPHEMYACLQSFGYNISEQTKQVMMKRYSRTAGYPPIPRIHFDDFVALCVRMRAFSDIFRRYDQAQNGFATFQYDQFLSSVMTL